MARLLQKACTSSQVVHSSIGAWEEEEVIKKLVMAIMADPEIAFGLKVTDITIQQNPDLTSFTKFQVASPVFINHGTKPRNTLYVFRSRIGPAYHGKQ
ncbi:MAG: hypothetical protein U5K79_13125 [Cyclobacteriaceae bacterium]|nr:hypothetical protein [Cyclobacteriaceae bacterium]